MLMSSLAYGPSLAIRCGCSAQGPVARPPLLSAINGLSCAGQLELFPWPAYIQTIPGYSVSALSLGHGDSLPRLSQPEWYPGISLVFLNIACSGRIGSHNGSKLRVDKIGRRLGVWVAPRTKCLLTHTT